LPTARGNWRGRKGKGRLGVFKKKEKKTGPGKGKTPALGQKGEALGQRGQPGREKKGKKNSPT